MCDTWRTKRINPASNRRISPTRTGLYKKLERFCKDEQTHCGKLKRSPEINPMTDYSSNARMKKIFEYLCGIANVSNKKNAKRNAKDAVEQQAFMDADNPLQCTLYKTVTLKEHQTKVCDYILKHKPKGLILFHSVGSGKTITSITIIRCKLQAYPNMKVFVATPKSLVDNFKKEMDKLKVDFKDQLKIYSHTGFVNRIENEGPEFTRNSLIIIDEAHNFRTRVSGQQGKRTRTLFTATHIAAFVVLLTATPVQNSISDITNLYAMVSGKEREVNKDMYEKFANSDPHKLLPLLDKKVSYFKNNDTTDYPSVSYSNKIFKMTPEFYKAYMTVEDNTSPVFDSKNLSVFYNGIRRAVNDIEGQETTPKVEWATTHIQKSVRNGQKVLLYSNWIKSGLQLIQSRLDGLGIPWAQVNGSMSISQRTAAMNKFNTDKVPVLCISSAGGEGLDLKGTRSVIILEPHWNNEKIKQVVGRAVRYGSHAGLPANERHVDVYTLILEKPGLQTPDRIPSADNYLLGISSDKDLIIERFYDVLIKCSI